MYLMHEESHMLVFNQAVAILPICSATSTSHNGVIQISCFPLLFLFGFHSGSTQINPSCARTEHITVGVQFWSESDDYWAALIVQ